MIYTSMEQLVGNTPMLELCRKPARVLAKLEGWNPGGSSKDRVALAMLLEAEESGRLPKGGTIIEPTSGNTGIGLAAVSAARGYRCIILMPDTMSPERKKLMEACGAQVILTPGAEGMSGAVVRAEALAKALPGSIIAGQFSNPANPRAHYETTGPEIWRDTEGRVDIFVAGVGTGGTVTGVSRYLKEKNPRVQVVAVEPEGSPLLSKGYAGAHGIMGIGANFVPEVLDRGIYDEILTVNEEQAYAAARELGRKKGILAGISSGAALHAAHTLAQRPENAGKTIVTLLPDSGERYLSTELFSK